MGDPLQYVHRNQANGVQSNVVKQFPRAYQDVRRDAIQTLRIRARTTKAGEMRISARIDFK